MKNLLICLSCFVFIPVFGQPSVAEQLGYPKGTKLLIIHADDLGVANAENSASLTALEQGCINSASIMVPCPWFPQVARYASEQGGDFGLHLTITSEWKEYKWGPVSSANEVSSLLDNQGYFYASVDSVRKYARTNEVETEVRNQVLKALASGIDVTHLDTHMGAMAARPELISVYINAGREFKLPVLLTPEIRAAGFPLTSRDVVLDRLYMASPADYEAGLAHYYRQVLSGMEPGLNCILLHAAYENDEMRAVTIDHEAYGARWRQQDFDFFTSDECAGILQENGIQLVTWKEIRDKIVRKE